MRPHRLGRRGAALPAVLAKMGTFGAAVAGLALVADSSQLHPTSSGDLLTLWAGAALGAGGTLWAVRQVLDLMRTLRPAERAAVPVHVSGEDARAALESDLREFAERLARLEERADATMDEMARMREQTQGAIAEFRRLLGKGRFRS